MCLDFFSDPKEDAFLPSIILAFLKVAFIEKPKIQSSTFSADKLLSGKLHQTMCFFFVFGGKTRVPTFSLTYWPLKGLIAASKNCSINVQFQQTTSHL